MAFTNSEGLLVSYECEELIEELEQDIDEFGDDLVVEVVTQMSYGVKIYKDYNFLPDDEPDGCAFVLNMDERVEHISAVKLLELYKQENEVL